MMHEYKLYANNECIETVTFDDESGTFISGNPMLKIIDLRSTPMTQQAKNSEIEHSQDDSPKNCPNCGAPIVGDSCEYCGTVFEKRETRIMPTDIEQEEQSYSDLFNLWYMETLNQQACDLRTAIMQASMATQTANLMPQLGYGTQGMRWTNAMAQQSPPDELEKFERQNLLAATNVYPYCNEPESKKTKKRTIIEFLKGL